MNLRKLESKDAPFMLEWMHEREVVKDLRTDFCRSTITDCMEFIDAAQKMEVNVHMAIVDEFDTYMGTVSLKHIEDHTAEFAIVMRMGAMGKGYSTYAIREMIKKGFEEIALERIYWCVDKANVRARRFYNKNGYTQIDWKYSELQKIVCKTYTIEEIESYIWYMVKNNEV